MKGEVRLLGQAWKKKTGKKENSFPAEQRGRFAKRKTCRARR